jgi:hypothetical protein
MARAKLRTFREISARPRYESPQHIESYLRAAISGDSRGEEKLRRIMTSAEIEIAKSRLNELRNKK